MSTDKDMDSLRAAESILNLMVGGFDRDNMVRALKLAYITGYRDRQAERVAELIERDDRISEVTG